MVSESQRKTASIELLGAKIVTGEKQLAVTKTCSNFSHCSSAGSDHQSPPAVLLYEDEYEQQLENFYALNADSLYSSDEGSDHLLVTIDYGYADSLEELEEATSDSYSLEPCAVSLQRGVYTIQEEDEKEEERVLATASDCDAFDMRQKLVETDEQQIWFYTPQLDTAAAFKVHHMQHAPLKDSVMSLLSSCSLIEYDVDADEEQEQILERKMLGVEYDDDDDDDDADHFNDEYEEQFYDSLGYI